MPFSVTWHTLLDECEDLAEDATLLTPLSQTRFQITSVQEHRIVIEFLDCDIDETRPHDPNERRYRETARELIDIFEAHLGEPKGNLEDAIDELTVADMDYKIIQGLAKLLRDESEFAIVAPAEPREIRQRLFERANDQYPIVRQPMLGEDTQKLDGVTRVEADHEGKTVEVVAEDDVNDADIRAAIEGAGYDVAA